MFVAQENAGYLHFLLSVFSFRFLSFNLDKSNFSLFGKELISCL